MSGSSRPLKSRVKRRPELKPLLTVSGIGQSLGLTVMLETGDIARFAKVGHDASDGRCVGRAHLSNGTRKGQGNTTNGNQSLAWACIEAAHFAVRDNPRIKRDDPRQCARTNAAIGIKTVAHKLARACFYILRDPVTFEVNNAFA